MVIHHKNPKNMASKRIYRRKIRKLNEIKIGEDNNGEIDDLKLIASIAEDERNEYSEVDFYYDGEDECEDNLEKKPADEEEAIDAYFRKKAKMSQTVCVETDKDLEEEK
jgi:hypothetical protein